MSNAAQQIHVEYSCDDIRLARLASEGWKLIAVTHWRDKRRDEIGEYEIEYDVAYLQRELAAADARENQAEKSK